MFNKLFGKTKTPEQKLADDLKARSQKLWREINAGEARRNQIGEIYTVLKECYDTFEKSIILENSRAYQLQHDGFDITQPHQDNYKR